MDTKFHTIEAGELSITFRIDSGEISLVQLFGEADLASAGALEATIAKAQRSRAAVLDLGGLEFIDSSAIAVLVRAVDHARERGHDLRLLRGPESVERTFEISGLEAYMPFVD